jgi:hypothetical protein
MEVCQSVLHLPDLFFTPDFLQQPTLSILSFINQFILHSFLDVSSFTLSPPSVLRRKQIFGKSPYRLCLFISLFISLFILLVCPACPPTTRVLLAIASQPASFQGFIHIDPLSRGAKSDAYVESSARVPRPVELLQLSRSLDFPCHHLLLLLWRAKPTPPIHHSPSEAP